MAVDSVSFTFGEGIYGLLGPNGAGKTTLIKCICGLLRPNTGSICLSDKSIGYLPQQFGAFKELTVRQMMEYFAVLKGLEKSKIDKEITLNLDHVHLTEHTDRHVGHLSGGMVRRLGIAQALLGDPEIILLDEPTVGLDPEERIRVIDVISRIKTGKTILVSTHIVEDVEHLCEETVIMRDGTIIQSTKSNEMASFAEGKAFLVREQDRAKLTAKAYIKNTCELDGTKYLYVLSSEDQPGENISATFEDGYLCVIKAL